jgi:3-phenylpropionate/trans-cinnamate dioxygenase ferredoxin subunit
MQFVKLAQTADVAPGTSRKVEQEGEAILIANVGGTLCAISGTCTHMGADLSKGTLREGIVTCPRHGAKFDLKTGANVGDAKFLMRKVKVNDVRSYPVKVEGNDVLVGMD